LTERTADQLDVDRVGVWHREDGDPPALRRAHLYDRASGDHRSGGLLSAGRFPAYFRALDDCDELAVEDVENDSRVRELVTPYARPLGIGAWL
ncbi:MAG: HTR-like protein, partial [Gemmatimonadota bacterium]